MSCAGLRRTTPDVPFQRLNGVSNVGCRTRLWSPTSLQCSLLCRQLARLRATGYLVMMGRTTGTLERSLATMAGLLPVVVARGSWPCPGLCWAFCLRPDATRHGVFCGDFGGRLCPNPGMRPLLKEMDAVHSGAEYRSFDIWSSVSAGLPFTSSGSPSDLCFARYHLGLGLVSRRGEPNAQSPRLWVEDGCLAQSARGTTSGMGDAEKSARLTAGLASTMVRHSPGSGGRAHRL